ncbi:MAG: branched-chain amino acid ABC transporter permease [Rhodospirillaceae bacterium]|nr:branched-chain amino acid ABC transporter permease [Rhodospirillaceae bacterium]MBT7595369.1 branched-chain amino acid ABC transporter permease [Gemmatimonadota bacterium]
MAEAIQLLISGISTGAIYALAAIGFVLLWQTTGTINFAQGEFVMLPSLIMLALVVYADIPLWVSFAITLVISGLLLGITFKTMVVQPMIRHGVLPLIIATIALSILMREGAKEFFWNEAQPFPMPVPYVVIHLGEVTLTSHHLFSFGVAVVLVVALQWFLARTRTGRSMQAVAQNPETAAILGIDVKRMITLTYLVNAALVTVAAILVTPIYLAKWDNGEAIGLTAFIAAIIGGFNQVRGAIVGGILVGVLENFSAFYISTEYRTAFPLILLIVVILFRPYGLLGRPEERTV